ncbi:peptidoglycan/LPS O-acetylase OafA/YrhL [Bradyrhizobium sp. USDA 4486]
MVAFMAGVVLADCRSSFPFVEWKRGFLLVAAGLFIIFAPLVSPKIQLELMADIVQMLVATAIVSLAVFSPFVRHALSSRTSSFFGKISFPLYLIHPILLCSAVSALSLTLLPIAGGGAKAITAAFAIVICIIGSVAFVPIERASISFSRRFSKLISGYQISDNRETLR